MPITTEHPLVGKRVIYCAQHEGARPIGGYVTSVNIEDNTVFARYDDSPHQPKGAKITDLTYLNGQDVTF